MLYNPHICALVFLFLIPKIQEDILHGKNFLVEEDMHVNAKHNI